MAMKLSLLLVLITNATLCLSNGGLAAQTLPTTQSELHGDQLDHPIRESLLIRSHEPFSCSAHGTRYLTVNWSDGWKAREVVTCNAVV